MELEGPDLYLLESGNEALMANFLKKPLYYWVKSFAEKEIHHGDSFKTFVGSNAVTYALEYIGIPTEEAEQSSLHLSSIFDEQDGPNSFNSSIGNRSSSNNNSLNSTLNLSHQHSSSYSHHSSTSTKLTNQNESETKSRILQFNKIFNDLKSYFEDHFNQLVLIKPPNTTHISTSCHACCLTEYEKILILLLGGAIQGVQRQDTIRKIKSYPVNIQEALIESIKLAADNPELLHIKPWNEYIKLSQDEQQKIYEKLQTSTRKLLAERNELFQTQLLSDFVHGFTNCERRRNHFEWKCEIIEAEKNSDELRTTMTMRQLRDELLEKSELLQECREELEGTKSQLQILQGELLDTQKQVKSFKKARDELDILRESQEKAQRLDAELQRMRKKLEDSEQYYEKIEILQNENRNYQLKHAILMDQINMLTVDKERLEISFFTQSHYKGRKDSEDVDDENESGLRRNKRRNGTNEELLIETNLRQEMTEPEPIAHGDDCVSTPLVHTTATSTSNLLEELTPIATTSNSNSPSGESPDKGEDTGTGDEVITTPYAQIKVSTSPNEKYASQKKQGRKGFNFSTKRTRKALFPPALRRGRMSPAAAAAARAKVQGIEGHNPYLSTEKVQEQLPIDMVKDDEPAEDDEQCTTTTIVPLQVASPPSTQKLGVKSRRSQRQKQWSIKDKRLVPNLEVEANDADEELSLSPKNIDDMDLKPTNNYSGERPEIFTNEPNEMHLIISEPMMEPNSFNSAADISSHQFEDTDLISNHSSLASEGSTSDNELFFICSSNATTPASTSNLRISNGRNVPIVQITTGSSTMRPSDSDVENDDMQRPSLGGRDSDRYTQDLLTNCNIQLSLHHVNSHSHDINVGANGLFEYPTPPTHHGPTVSGRMPTSTAYVNKLPRYSEPSTPPVNFNFTHGGTSRHSQCVPADDGSTSSEDDDSVWYEYGCV